MNIPNVNGEFEFVKYDPKNLIGYEKYADEEEMCLDFIVYLKDGMIPIGNLVYDRYGIIPCVQTCLTQYLINSFLNANVVYYKKVVYNFYNLPICLTSIPCFL